MPLDICQELNHLYSTRMQQAELDNCAILLLTMGIFRDTLQLQQNNVFDLQRAALNDHLHHYMPLCKSVPKTFLGTRVAIEYLQILCLEYSNTQKLPSLKSVILHHYYSIGILLGMLLWELFCYYSY